VNELTQQKALVVGASRTIGAGLVRELAARGWDVTGTVRGDARTELHALADTAGGRIRVEQLDITDDDGIASLRGRCAEGSLDLLFVNAGVADPDEPVGTVSADVFTEVMITNALAPLHVIEGLSACVKPHGTIGVMTSTQGSISLNERGGHEVYRASKAALNQLMRSYAARHGTERTLLLMDPGWVQTDLGGEGAPLSVADSVSGVVTTIERHAGATGLQFRDHRDHLVPW
jgi:NAD(P)-dependent dehydrogenase (short-subunit alcohol dehydrogenase family)